MADTLTSAALCSACGANLGGNKVCVACLLRAGLDEPEVAPIAGNAVTFGDFEIERREDGSLCELGRGAMGVTYRALDTVLHRPVALKVIEPPASVPDSEAMRERFLREARAAAALRHPNVAAVFHFSAAPEMNRCYCAMELVEGETLDARVRREGPLPVELAIEVAIQVTRALIAAAERGLVHRDLKPGNIMLTHADDADRVEVKVIDFGLAKAAVTAAAAMELTHGGFVGTPAFASPEQFAGEAVDARSDIYALGVTLWFALTGRLPFAGSSIEEIRQNQGHSLPLEQLRRRLVPRPVIELLRSCLEPNPEKRPPSAQALMHELEACRPEPASPPSRTRKVVLLAVAAAWVAAAVTGLLLLQSNRKPPAAPPPALEKGIAVLPFENLSTDPADAFFAEGMQDDVLTSIGRIGELKVIARASVIDYRGAHDAGKIRQIGEALGVSHVLTGSIRRAGTRMAINVSLIEAGTERQIWAERYERKLTDALSLQNELALEIAHAVKGTLTPAEKKIVTGKPTNSLEAYLLYLRGREKEIVAVDLKAASALYREAIALDPAFALARARLAICLVELYYTATSAIGRDPNAVRAEAEEALRLQPSLGEAHLALGRFHMDATKDQGRAHTELVRAAELLPNSAEVQLAMAFLAKRRGNFRERIAALERAESLDPRNNRVLSFLTLTHRWLRQWPEAIHASDRLQAVSTGERPRAGGPWPRAQDEFNLTGDLAPLKKAVAEAHVNGLDRSPYAAMARHEIAVLERDFTAAARFLAEVPANEMETAYPFSSHRKIVHEALLAAAQGGDAASSEPMLARAAEQLAGITVPDFLPYGDATRRTDLALIQALRGHREGAVREALLAVEIGEKNLGLIELNAIRSALALVYARTDEPEKALDLIEHLLTVPTEVQSGRAYNMTLADLKWRWVWDPLRSHPRFQKLLAGPEPKTVY